MNKTTAPYTPMMMQYLKIKDQYPDTLIFFRLGDFYELFFDDAKTASKELSLVLTGKSAGQPERVPMCGVPYHAAKSYIKKLIERGYKVGLVEQLEDASVAKGLVQRDVTHIYTPGSFVEDEDVSHNFLVAMSTDGVRIVLIYGDASTGDVYLDYLENQPEILQNYLQKIACHEVVLNQDLANLLEPYLTPMRITLSIQPDQPITHAQQNLDMVEQLTYQRWLDYLQFTQRKNLSFLKPILRLDQQSTMKIDGISLANLEILQSLKHQETHGSLFGLLNETVTPMGSRLLRQWLVQPSTHLLTIRMRHQFVDECMKKFLELETLRTLFKSISDLPRLVGKINLLQVNAKEILALKYSLIQLPSVLQTLSTFSSPLAKQLQSQIKVLPEVVELLERAIHEDPPISLKEGQLIKSGFNENLDHWLHLAKNGKYALIDLEKNERIRTSIKNLKVGYNQVFGYYLEISNGQLASLKPEYGYERRQTLANGERFITKELKALESDLLQAEENQKKIEESLFFEIVTTLQRSTSDLQKLADVIAQLDVLLAFAFVSSQYQFVAPMIDEKSTIEIEQCRHPVIEKVMKRSVFVANDFKMDDATNTILITGPNMGGKSTMMRQIALVMIMSQIGCFVPAKKARLMIVDAIFTRIGASDDLVGGQSTFMMEMTQTQFALANATDRSLLIFDEIGRGTATFDGMALAQAIIEYTTLTLKAKTLFSTHYHELTQLEANLPTLKNMHVAVHEENEKVTFLYQLRHGAMSRSFGIHVAQLASLPIRIIDRAKIILNELEKQPQLVQPITEKPKLSSIEQSIQKINPLKISPLEALQILVDLKKKLG
jgi:DNA mismatch repair protein MutS